mmetsp:Transcript_115125/g.229290  ORF Transcript_115125/g.229290 Transcript_115125/m.229290 type:complete len:431 (-) Transcript_115125:135-1427(-)
MWCSMLGLLTYATLLDFGGALRGQFGSAPDNGGLTDVDGCISSRDLKLVCPETKILQIASAHWHRRAGKNCNRKELTKKAGNVARAACDPDASVAVGEICSGKKSCTIPVGFTGCPEHPYRQLRIVYDCWDASDDEDRVRGPSKDVDSNFDQLAIPVMQATTMLDGKPKTTPFDAETETKMFDGGTPTTTADGETAWDILCLSGKVGEFRHWGQVGCNSFSAALRLKQCHRLDVKCDIDKRVQDITLWWKVTGAKKVLRIPKTAKPISAKDQYYYRFFLTSEGCPHGNNAEDCDLPWAAFNEPRKVSSVADVTRRFIVYDSRIPGNPLMRMETNKYHAEFLPSEFAFLGTGLPLPEAPTFAGSHGTNCSVSQECAEPPRSEAPVPSTDFKVTSNYIMESPSDPGHIVLMSNHNEARVTETYVVEFSAESR